MTNGAVPMVEPPMGERRPLGGGPQIPLGVGSAPPLQPNQTSMMAPPSWMQAPQQQPVHVPVEQRFAPHLLEAMAMGLQNDAPANEICEYVKCTLEDLQEFARSRNLRVNIGQGPLIPPSQQVQASPPQQQTQSQPQQQQSFQPGLIAQAMAPAAENVVAAARQEQPVQQQPNNGPIPQRVTKKHHPLIEEAMRHSFVSGQQITGEQIAAALNLPLPGVQKYMREVEPKIRAELLASAGQPQQTPQVQQVPAPQPVQPTNGNGSNGHSAYEATQSFATVLPANEPLSRPYEVLQRVAQFAEATGFGYHEIEAAAALLITSR